jgi:hypothetical protein
MVYTVLYMRKEAVSVVFDIGSASVGGYIVHTKKSDSTLLWGVRADYAFNPVQSYGVYVKKMQHALAKVADAVVREGLALSQEKVSFRTSTATLTCVVDAPWSWGEVRTFEENNAQPFLVNHQWRDSARASLEQEGMKSPAFLSWQGGMGEVETLEMEDTRCTGDGYPLDEKEKSEVSEATLSVYHSFLSHVVSEEVRSYITRVFPHHPLTCTSLPHFLSPLLTTCTLAREGRTVFLVPTEFETHVLLFEKSALVGASLVPFGTLHLVRTCAPSTESKEEAVSVARHLLQGVSEKTPPPKATVRTLAEWRAGVDTKILEMTHGLPPRSAVCVAGPLWYRAFRFALLRLETGVRLAPYRFAPTQERDPTVPLRDFRARLVAHALAYAEPLAV